MEFSCFSWPKLYHRHWSLLPLPLHIPTRLSKLRRIHSAEQNCTETGREKDAVCLVRTGSQEEAGHIHAVILFSQSLTSVGPDDSIRIVGWLVGCHFWLSLDLGERRNTWTQARSQDPDIQGWVPGQGLLLQRTPSTLSWISNFSTRLVTLPWTLLFPHSSLNNYLLSDFYYLCTLMLRHSVYRVRWEHKGTLTSLPLNSSATVICPASETSTYLSFFFW
jgi:hypothetical protein